MHKHHFWMMIGCILPILLIFLLPVFNISSPLAIFIIILIMFIGHFFMMSHHAGHSHNQKDEGENHEQHKH